MRLTARDLAWIALPLVGWLVQLVPWAAPPTLPLPYVEPEPKLSRDGRFLTYTAQRGARQEHVPRCFGRRGAYPAQEDQADAWRLNLADGSRVRLALQGSSDGASPSADGSRVAFRCPAGIFLFDESRGTTAVGPAGPTSAPALSDDGTLVAFSRAGAAAQELVVWDCGRGLRIPADLPPSRGPLLGPPNFSGRKLAFSLAITGGAEIWSASVDPGGLGSRARVGEGLTPVLAGAFCAYQDGRQLGVSHDGKLSLPLADHHPDGASLEPVLSADGRWLAFTSYATNLGPDDGNGKSDVFLLDRSNGELELVSHTPQGEAGNGASYAPTLSADGSRLVFASLATNLGDSPAPPGLLYLWERQTGRTSRLAP